MKTLPYILGAAGIGLVGWHLWLKKKDEVSAAQGALLDAEATAAAAEKEARKARRKAKKAKKHLPTRVIRLSTIDPNPSIDMLRPPFMRV
jgi:hypothetical protein